MSRFLIYGLIDPRTLFIRYIGLSSSGMARPAYHRTPSGMKISGHRTSWIKGLRAEGLDYATVVLAEASSKASLCDEERFWIAYGRACGWPLTNIADGGEGGASGLKRGPRSPEHRAKLSRALRGRKLTAEQRARISEALRARVRKPETYAKIANALRGRPLPAAQRAYISKIQTGRKLPAQTRARMSESARLAWARRKEGSNGTQTA
jgi:hypothetical protein